MTQLAVVLAAGGSRRFDAPDGASKLLASVGDTSLVRRCLDVAVAALAGPGIDEVAVVEGAVSLEGEVPPGVTRLANPRWSEGISTSLLVAVEHARAQGHDAVVVGLGDQPGIVTAAWRAVARAPVTRPIAVATYKGGRANPVRLPSSVWHLLPTDGDEGARALMRDRPDLVQEVPCQGDPRDVDTQADLDAWLGDR